MGLFKTEVLRLLKQSIKKQDSTLRSLERLGTKIMDFEQALDLLTTNIGDLDASIQQEIAEFEELKNQQGGILKPDQQEKFNALLARIQQSKAALDAHS